MNMNPNPLSTVYATKRRRRSTKSLRPTPKEPPGQTKSNPSKRHRERLNGELDHLASLLPFEPNILSKLDRLSILRLAVAFLRTKTYFQISMAREKEDLQHEISYRRDFCTFDNQLLDGEMFLQPPCLNGFLMILDCNGELFFATHTIETFLGFHQSDVIHQSVYELVHSEDREELQRQLIWNSFLTPEEASSGVTLQDLLQQENSSLLERSFTVRFRCLLDNTSGFLRLDIRGRIKVLHGQNKKSDEAPLALFCICTPFGPPSLLEVPQKDVMFKSKHKLDLSFISMDTKGKELLGYEEEEVADMGGYDLVHYDDLAYVASAHQELKKTGASGMIAYRLMTKNFKWQWLQTSSRLVYKNSKPDFIVCTHRPLMEEEGLDLLGKRTMDFKVTYLDAGPNSSYLNDGESLSGSTGGTTNGSTTGIGQAKLPKRYKSQYRDYMGSGRGKRKSNTTAPAGAELYNDHSIASYASLYTAQGSTLSNPYAAAAAAGATDTQLYLQQQNLATPYNTIYSSVENRYGFPSEYLANYTRLSSYYPEAYASAHAAQYIGNSYFDVSGSPRPQLYDSQIRYIDDKTTPTHGGGAAEYKYPFDQGKPDASKRNDKKPGNEDGDKGVKCEPVSINYDYVPRDGNGNGSGAAGEA